MSPRFYRFCYCIARVFIGMVYRLDITGRENIPEGPAMICANHSSSIDPFFMAFAFGIQTQLHIIAKAELFKIPILSAILKKLGMISVDRSISDVTTIKATLGYLKNGEKVAIFPEGTRVSADNAVTAKNGAVKLAERTGVPIVPMYMPRRKRIFSKIPVVIGQPYKIEKSSAGKRTAGEYEKLSGDLMAKITQLNPGVAS